MTSRNSNDNRLNTGVIHMVNRTELSTDVLAMSADYDGHLKVVRFEDDKTGLRAFISVHNSNLGPALGGCRMTTYGSEQEALTDVLRLSRGMTYKNALAGLPLGGGKSVIIGNPYKDKTEEMMAAMGHAVASLNGLYITAEDSGTTEADMEVIAKQTSYVVGLPGAGDSDLGGNPSPVTAYGVFSGLKAGVKKRFGTGDLSGLRVAVQGLGAVGYGLCEYLHAEGAELVVTDMREAVLEQASSVFERLNVVRPEEIFAVEADVFAPCALGAQINDETISQFKVGVIAGAANNQLAEARHGLMLAEKDILYVPDYVLNAGGVIAVCYEYYDRIRQNPFAHDLNRETMMAHVNRIGPTVTRIFDLADKRGITPAQAADELAESIFKGEESAATQVRMTSAG